MSSWTGRRVLVTGCTGFVGSWLSHALVERGADVTGLLWDSASIPNFYRLRLHERITGIRGHIGDLGLLRQILREREIDSVFHLAAQAIVTEANRSPLDTFQVNIGGTWTLLEAVREAAPQVQRVVVAASDKVYGDQPLMPYTEGTPLGALHPYDVSKACADMLAASYAKTFGMPVTIVRCGNIYGGGDLNFGRLIPGTIRSIVSGERPVLRSDGTFTRDFVHVKDVINAYLLVAEATHDERFRGEAFNIGNEDPVPVLEVVEKILELMCRPQLQPVIANVASGEIRHQWLSASRAREDLGWRPTIPLESGLREAVAWYEDFFVTGNLVKGKSHGD